MEETIIMINQMRQCQPFTNCKVNAIVPVTISIIEIFRTNC